MPCRLDWYEASKNTASSSRKLHSYSGPPHPFLFLTQESQGSLSNSLAVLGVLGLSLLPELRGVGDELGLYR